MLQCETCQRSLTPDDVRFCPTCKSDRSHRRQQLFLITICLSIIVGLFINRFGVPIWDEYVKDEWTVKEESQNGAITIKSWSGVYGGGGIGYSSSTVSKDSDVTLEFYSYRNKIPKESIIVDDPVGFFNLEVLNEAPSPLFASLGVETYRIENGQQLSSLELISQAILQGMKEFPQAKSVRVVVISDYISTKGFGIGIGTNDSIIGVRGGTIHEEVSDGK